MPFYFILLCSQGSKCGGRDCACGLQPARGGGDGAGIREMATATSSRSRKQVSFVFDLANIRLCTHFECSHYTLLLNSVYREPSADGLRGCPCSRPSQPLGRGGCAGEIPRRPVRSELQFALDCCLSRRIDLLAETKVSFLLWVEGQQLCATKNTKYEHLNKM